MIDSFGIMAIQGIGQPHAVTGGVAEALICTAAGIFVAVMTLIPYNYFLTRTEIVTESIETLRHADRTCLTRSDGGVALMRLPAAVKKKARIEIIPMIDTMFFLLVFFMIATLSMTLQKGMPVNLPTASSTTDDLPEQVTLSISKNGDVHFNKDPVTLEELEARLDGLLLLWGGTRGGDQRR